MFFSLFQDSLGGNTKTVMCANLGPAGPNFDETISTLRYADRAKQIKNKPVINEDPKDTKLREMQEEIAQLKAMLEARKRGGVVGANVNFDMASSGHPQSSEGEHMLGMEQIDGDNVIEEIVEKEKIVDTGIKQEDLDEIKRQAEAEHARLLEEFMKQTRNEEDARRMAEESAANYEKDLRHKAEILAKENAQLEQMEKALREKEDHLQKGGAALDQAQRTKEQLRRTELELQARRAEQERAYEEMRQAEEDRALRVEHYNNSAEELKMKTAKLKKLWALYQDKKADLIEVQNEFDLERNDYLDTIRSLDRQIKLKNLVMEEFIPPHYSDLIENHAVYDHINDAWMVEGVEYAGNNVARSEMYFGGGGNNFGGPSASTGNLHSQSPQRRMFKRGGMPQPMQHHLNGMHQQQMMVNGLSTCAAPSQARFFSYSEFVQAKSPTAGDRDRDAEKEERKKKKKSKN